VEPLTVGNYSSALNGLRGQGTEVILLACVVIPSLSGIVCRLFCSRWIDPIKPVTKFINSVVLLVLCYANASSVLPKIFSEPDWDFLILCLVAVATLCFVAFLAGWAVARMLRASESLTQSLIFALGMNNNGAGIVLACSTLAGYPGAVLPVLAYNLVQHLVAGGVNRRMARWID
jgi:BASS family bile acid:Na+ symporter